MENKIFLRVGDDYDLEGHDPSTPCRTKQGKLLTLREAVEQKIPDDFYYHLGHNHWEIACVSEDEAITFEIKLVGKNLSADKIGDALEAFLKDPSFKKKFGIHYISRWIDR